jgi:hypothetical protein
MGASTIGKYRTGCSWGSRVPQEVEIKHVLVAWYMEELSRRGLFVMK